MENNTPQEIWNKLKESKNILMSLHSNPDGDSLGSCTAFKRILQQNTTAKIKIISADQIDKALMEHSFSKDVEFGKDLTELNLKEFDTLIALDTSNPFRIGKEKEKDYKIPEELFTINIDHHHTNQNFGNLNYVIPDAPSCCSVLLSLFKELKLKIDKETAERLLLGIATDSGFFTNPNSEQPIKDASELISLGAKYYDTIINPVYNQKSLSQAKYKALLLQNLKIDKEKHLAYSTISYEEIKELKLNGAEIRGGISEIRSIENVDFCFTLIGIPEGIKGSFRSKIKIDVSLFAKALGGGGHKQAAAFILPKMSTKDAEKKVLEAIDKVGIQKFN